MIFKLQKYHFYILFIISIVSSCGNNSVNNNGSGNKDYQSEKDTNSLSGQDTINTDTQIISLSKFLNPLLADGFDYPVGNKDGKGKYTSITDSKTYDSWYISIGTGESYSLGIHTGEDWNGTGGGNTDLGQPVFSTASGKVIAAADYYSPWGNTILIEHVYLENGKPCKVFSLYAHLDEIFINKEDTVKRRQKIGAIGTGGGAYIAHLHFEIRKQLMEDYPVDYWPSSDDKDLFWVLKHYEKPSVFINNHRVLTCPVNEERMIIAIKHKYAMYLINQGKIAKQYEIALSQNPVGHKEHQGDNRLPEGEYKIIEKSRGPFSGNFSEFFGVAWIRINYPNSFDATEGYKKGYITKTEKDAIINANKNNQEPSKYTKLGGGIGIHGWAGDWIADESQNLTWGCISMHNQDLDKFFNLLPLYTKIIIVE